MFITDHMLANLRRNTRQTDWGIQAARTIIDQARPWLDKSDEELWNLMFGATLPRCWQIYPSGFCPSCKTAMAMSGWRMDGFKNPWKATCVHCGGNFPKNDFGAFHRSGLDAHGVFDPQRADRRLLFNTEHPDPKDPLHQFGVDDGNGYREGDHCWYFIGAYLIYGLWKQQIVNGIDALSQAYVVTGELIYAHKAAVLLDRVADLYPSFDFKTQARPMNPGQAPGNGYVSTWHDACEESRSMVLAYDSIRDALANDKSLRDFLSAQASRYQLANPKREWADVRRNIEDGILRDGQRNAHRVESNYPRGIINQATIVAVLGDPGHELILQEMLDAIAEQSTRTDGITGEKGLASYSAYTMHVLAEYLAQWTQRDPAFLPALLERHPRLRQTYRFHIDTWCLQKYYPNIGDAHGFAEPHPAYAPMFLSREPGLRPSLFTFLMALGEATGDKAYAQVIYHSNNHSTEHLPYDLFAEDPAAFQKNIEKIIGTTGPIIELPSVNKEEWGLAILRSGRHDQARALWLDYDIGGGHAHSDGLNLGLFGRGLDLLPDLGYPQIQFIGREPLKSGWFTRTACHNTVVVDGRDQNNIYKPIALGKTALWADGQSFHAIRAGFSADPVPLPVMTGRTVAHVALYAYNPGRFSAVRVWTRRNTSEPWSLQFTEDFQSTELGPDWKVLEGQWRVENGQLTGKGLLLCLRNFPGHQRLEYIASSVDDNPCDLSAYLGWNGNASGAFYGFGSNLNRSSKILYRSLVTAENPVRIVPGQRHHVACFCEEGRLEMIIDGTHNLQSTHLRNNSFDLIFGDATGPKQFERTAALVDISANDFYLVDIFRVVGGTDHARFFHSYLGNATSEGLKLSPAPEYGQGSLMRHFQTDPAPRPGWAVDWKINDYFKQLPPGTDLHVRHIDLTPGASGSLAESWINIGNYESCDEHWIPTIMTRRQGTAPLASTFVEIIEPYEGKSNIRSVRRLALQTPDGTAYPDNHVAIEIELTDGRRDLVIAADVENALKTAPAFAAGSVLVQPDWQVRTDAELSLIRRDKDGRTTYTTLSRGSFLESGEKSIRHPARIDFAEA